MTISISCQTPAVPDLDLALDVPLDLVMTLRPLVRGQGDRTIRLATATALWTTRTQVGPATLHFRQRGDRLLIDAYGPGAELAMADGRAERLVGVDGASSGLADLIGHDDARIDRLARRFRGVRLTRSEAVLDALIPAILEQRVTGAEARRAWQGLVRAHGEDAPGPAALVAGLRVAPAPGVLAALPYYAYHPFGIEQRRAELVRGVARRAASLEGIVELPLPEAHARLQAVPGIGPWTAAEVAVRALGDPDAVSVGDFHLPNLVAFALAGEPRGDDARMLELIEPFRGRRALVMRALELSGVRAPRYGPRLSPRRIDAI